jgi:hypothetical protein
MDSPDDQLYQIRLNICKLASVLRSELDEDSLERGSAFLDLEDLQYEHTELIGKPFQFGLDPDWPTFEMRRNAQAIAAEYRLLLPLEAVTSPS